MTRRRASRPLATLLHTLDTPPPRPPGDDPRAGLPMPPVWHDDGSVTLWHPDSPGVRLTLHRPTWARRHLRRRESFATLREVLAHYRERAHRCGDPTCTEAHP